jgi:signal transduction histidine kinase
MLSSMQGGDPNETITNLLGIAMRSSDRIQRLLNSLLDIYRLEGGQAITTQKEVHPAILIQEAIETINPGLIIKHQEVVVKVDTRVKSVWVDNEMVRRVLINLIENAGKFSGSNTKIEIGTRSDEENTLFWVKDEGPGIPEEEKENIFQKFARLQQSGTSKGLGLGLAFCKLVIQAHGGKIWVDSTLGKGSTFAFTIPHHNA